MRSLTSDELLDRLERLTEIGVSLSVQRDTPRLLETILLAAKSLTNADGGTLYRVLDDRFLRFEIMRTDSLGIAMGGTSGKEIPFPPLPLYRDDGTPNESLVVAYAVLHDRTINIADAYEAEGFDFSGTKRFDQNTGYRSKSFLTIPMKNHENEIIGVLQLLNARDTESGEIVSFSPEDQQLVESLASQAAIALTNRQLIEQLESLFESFIKLINIAIDEKSPYTGGHCERVPVLAQLLAEAVNSTGDGPLAPHHMNERELYELKIAALLHDCGKVTTPVHVVDKSTKLETIYDRIHEVDTRFEVLKRDAEIAMLKAQLAGQSATEAEAAFQETVRALNEERDFLRKANIGGEFMSPELQERVQVIAARRWVGPEGSERPLLDEGEVKNLNIARGTLTPEERDIINYHVTASIKMLEALPWPKHLRHVPEFAGGHHERMDGKGYPRGLTGEQMSVQARLMAIADVFEALTAKDRPYKPGRKLSEALTILGRMKLEHHVDPDLFDLFVREKVYLRYAERYLEADQIDTVDESKIPGYAS